MRDSVLSKEMSKTGGNETTPLCLAIKMAKTSIALQLIENGADLSASDKLGYSALHYAVLTNNGKLVESLLQHESCPINKASKTGKTPLLIAVEQGQEMVVSRLLQKGAEKGDNMFIPFAKNNDRIVGLLKTHQIFYCLEDLEKVKQLVKGSKFSAVSRDQRLGANERTVLIAAIEENRLDAAKFLLAHSQDLSLIDSKGRDALYVAAELGKKSILKSIIKCYKKDKLDLNRKRVLDAWTALMSAAAKGHLECVELLLDAGSDKTLRNFEGKTAADLAEENSRVKVVKAIKKFIHGTTNEIQADNILPDLRNFFAL
jgi:ankyrin repeat protein